MPIIKPDMNIITQINVFTVPMGEQQQLIDYLAGAARVAREVDGWLSASLHRSLDGTRVATMRRAPIVTPRGAYSIICKAGE